MAEEVSAWRYVGLSQGFQVDIFHLARSSNSSWADWGNEKNDVQLAGVPRGRGDYG
jgi:hypothetical protein